MATEYTPELIKNLKPHEVFVFGTNQLASHDGGAAWYAKQAFGAVDGIGAIGLVGQCYGIITTSFNKEPITIQFIRHQVKVLYGFASIRSDLKFYVTKIGCGIAGFDIKEIAYMFNILRSLQPANIILPIEFN